MDAGIPETTNPALLETVMVPRGVIEQFQKDYLELNKQCEGRQEQSWQKERHLQGEVWRLEQRESYWLAKIQQLGPR